VLLNLQTLKSLDEGAIGLFYFIVWISNEAQGHAQ